MEINEPNITIQVMAEVISGLRRDVAVMRQLGVKQDELIKQLKSGGVKKDADIVPINAE